MGTTNKIRGIEAENECKRFNLDLASIVNDEENDLTRDVLNEDVANAAWIGVFQNGDSNNDGHYFSDGTRMEYEQWGQSKPNDKDKTMTVTYKKGSWVDGWADEMENKTSYRAFCVKNNYCKDPSEQKPQFKCRPHQFQSGLR